jgi:hypothetical protein
MVDILTVRSNKLITLAEKSARELAALVALTSQYLPLDLPSPVSVQSAPPPSLFNFILFSLEISPLPFLPPPTVQRGEMSLVFPGDLKCRGSSIPWGHVSS